MHAGRRGEVTVQLMIPGCFLLALYQLVLNAPLRMIYKCRLPRGMLLYLFPRIGAIIIKLKEVVK